MTARMGSRGVLLVNLGTPRSPKPADVYQYLIEFLTDNRVIDYPRFKRELLVRGLIVPFRYKQSAEQYRGIWTDRGSPLLIHGERVQELLQSSLGDDFYVGLAMRYQEPSIKNGLDEMQRRGVSDLTILPLFPQYASATTGSVYQKVMEEILQWQLFPKLRFINSFYDHPKMIAAFSARAKQRDLSDYDHILFSFHGLPERQIRKGDTHGKCLTQNCCKSICFQNKNCYKAQCVATAQAIAKQLDLEEKDYTICFQSRLGKEPWIQPYASDVLHQCAKQGFKRLLVFSPSFICDCLETIFEIGSEYQKEFKELGGEELHLVEGLNDHPLWIEALRDLVLESNC